MAEPYVLVVEDDRPVRELLVRWLTMMGYSALAVENADEAISTIAREQPFAVITDVVIPPAPIGVSFVGCILPGIHSRQGCRRRQIKC
jgi:CheY-like chemotaxis protein